MTPEEMKIKAENLYRQRLHCSQAVIAVGLEKLGIDAPDAIKAVGLYGGGIGSSGNVCGAMLGGVAAISSLFSRSSLEEKENPRMWKINSQFMKKFQELTSSHGGITCKDIAKINWRDREQVKDFYSNPASNRKHCVELVGRTAFVLGEILESELKKANNEKTR